MSGRGSPVVLVTGPPASGKTTLARVLAERLQLPLFAKDNIKERLYAELGPGDRDWSRRLGAATYSILFGAIRTCVAAGTPVLVQGTFGPVEARAELRAIHARHPLHALELHCTAPPHVLAARYRGRAPTRHPGHADDAIVDEVTTWLLAGEWGPLNVGGPFRLVDTTDFEQVEVDDIALLVSAHIADVGD